MEYGKGQGGFERAREGIESQGGMERPGRVVESQGGLERIRKCWRGSWSVK